MVSSGWAPGWQRQAAHRCAPPRAGSGCTATSRNSAHTKNQLRPGGLWACGGSVGWGRGWRRSGDMGGGRVSPSPPPVHPSPRPESWGPRLWGEGEPGSHEGGRPPCSSESAGPPCGAVRRACPLLMPLSPHPPTLPVTNHSALPSGLARGVGPVGISLCQCHMGERGTGGAWSPGPPPSAHRSGG